MFYVRTLTNNYLPAFKSWIELSISAVFLHYCYRSLTRVTLRLMIEVYIDKARLLIFIHYYRGELLLNLPQSSSFNQQCGFIYSGLPIKVVYTISQKLIPLSPCLQNVCTGQTPPLWMQMSLMDSPLFIKIIFLIQFRLYYSLFLIAKTSNKTLYTALTASCTININKHDSCSTMTSFHNTVTRFFIFFM